MLTDLMQAASFIGSALFYIPLLVVLYWCVNPRWAARAAVVLSLSSVFNTLLKQIFHEPRPFWTDRSITPHETRDSFGMPSGHAQNAVAVWGFLGAHTRRRLLWAGAVLLILLIGVSRIHLGVHSIGQVLAGWAIGLVVLAVALVLEPIVVSRWVRRPLAVQLVFGLAVSMLFLVGSWQATEALDGWRMPPEWARAITAAGGTVEPISMSEGAAAAGGLFGVIAGVSWLGHHGWFDAGGALWRRLARIPVGAAGAVLIYSVELLLGGHALVAYIVQALLGLWATAGAPELFLRLRLATRTTPELTPVGETALSGHS